VTLGYAGAAGQLGSPGSLKSFSRERFPRGQQDLLASLACG
jgi:hypothetical protein